VRFSANLNRTTVAEVLADPSMRIIIISSVLMSRRLCDSYQEYRLMTARPLPRERLRPGLVARAAEPTARTIGDLDLARAVWAFAHGMAILERDG
jgi:hypothetical protein